MTPDRKLNILLLCDDKKGIAATVHDHIEALQKYSQHCWWPVSTFGDIPEGLDLNRFDVIVIHYSLLVRDERYLSPASRKRLGQSRALKAMFVQDEYCAVNVTTAAMRQIGINVLFTCVPDGEVEKVYSPQRLPGVAKVSVLTGYVPQALAQRPVPSFAERPIDIGYRGRHVPAWLGQLGQEKWLIGERVRVDASRWGLITDISVREEDRLYGEKWIGFVMRCKAMLGTESGASVFDFDGELQRKVEQHLARDPTLSFKELQGHYFSQLEDAIHVNQISPRCFEAAALRTLMVLYEGDYSGVLEPYRHYVPLKKDHSNMAEVTAILRDPVRSNEIVERAYREVALNPRWSFARSVEDVDKALEQAWVPQMMSELPFYSEAELQGLAKPNLTQRRRLAIRAASIAGYRFLFGRVLGWLTPNNRDRVHRRLRQAYKFVTTFYLRKPSL